MMLLRSLLVAAWLVTSSLCAPTDPSEYFGGTNNEAYLAWVDTLVNQTLHAFIPTSGDPNKGAAVHWVVTDEGYIELAVAVQATGWLGLGFSPVGGMIGSDMLLVEAAKPSFVIDAHVKSERVQPQEDTCQDWEMMAGGAVMNSGFMMVQVRRLLETADTQDLPFFYDADFAVPASHVIAAWGDDTTVGYHGDNKARSTIRWFSDGTPEDEAFQMGMDEQSSGSLVVQAKDHPIKVQEIDYAYFCFNSSELEELGSFSMEEGVYLIGMKAVVDNAKHVRSFFLYGNTQDFNRTNEFKCAPGENGFKGEVAYVSAPGESPFSFPENVGMAVGGANDNGAFRSFMLEIRYGNADLAQNQTDNSGVELFFTAEPREFMAAMMTIGDQQNSLQNTSVGLGVSDWMFSCPDTCATLATDAPINVLRESLRMNQAGYSIYIEQIRNSIPSRTGRVEYWDYALNGNPQVQQDPFPILSGDSFNLRCFYKNDDKNRTFGLESEQEVCVAFLLYYPRTTINVSGVEVPWVCNVGFSGECDVSYETEVLPKGEEPELIFGSEDEICKFDDYYYYYPDGIPANDEANSTVTSGSSRVATQGAVTSFSILLSIFTLVSW